MVILKFFKRIIYNRYLAKVVTLMENVRWQNEYNLYRKKYEISDSFKFNGTRILLYGDGEIILKSGSYIGNYSTIQSSNGYKVIINENCSISHNVRIYTTNKNAEDVISQSNDIRNNFGDVIIGCNTWIGANVFITEGVKIGDYCVIGANAVVTKDIPSNSVAAGVPAVVIKKYSV